MWQWGYFTEVPDLVPSCDRSGKDLRILWAGRMLGWKRVDTLIVAFAQLSKRFPRATLTLAGHGPREARLRKLAAELLSPGTFEFLPAMPVQEVLRLMRQHHIYVLPSTGTEGWGAVVNEAMTQGCAVVASEAAGSAKTLIRHGINGMLFPPNDAEALGQLLCELAESPELTKRLAEEGQRTITYGWTPAIAAERFLAVSDALLANREVPVFTDGPMSPAWE
jgi:glycosyltransferase involved in cell wall biosynthesis